MKAFIVMPFTKQLDNIFAIIKNACNNLSITSVRADEIKKTGPIINQIFKAIEDASFVIAEVSDKNPNVFYEVAVAHTLSKPTILLARTETITDLPFDIRHQRVLIYNTHKKEELRKNLTDHLIYLKTTILGDSHPANISTHLADLSSKRENSETLRTQIIDQTKRDFGLINPTLTEEKFTDQGELLITLTDDFGEKVVLLVDINGIIRRKQRL